MGRRGYVQTRQAEHNGSDFSYSAAESASSFLFEHGIDVVMHPGGMGNDGDNDQWEIEIPIRRKKVKGRDRYWKDFAKISKIAHELRANPGLVIGDDGKGEYGDQLAGILEDGIEAAKKYDYGWIIVDWWN